MADAIWTIELNFSTFRYWVTEVDPATGLTISSRQMPDHIFPQSIGGLAWADGDLWFIGSSDSTGDRVLRQYNFDTDSYDVDNVIDDSFYDVGGAFLIFDGENFYTYNTVADLLHKISPAGVVLAEYDAPSAVSLEADSGGSNYQGMAWVDGSIYALDEHLNDDIGEFEHWLLTLSDIGSPDLVNYLGVEVFTSGPAYGDGNLWFLHVTGGTGSTLGQTLWRTDLSGQKLSSVITDGDRSLSRPSWGGIPAIVSKYIALRLRQNERLFPRVKQTGRIV